MVGHDHLGDPPLDVLKFSVSTWNWAQIPDALPTPWKEGNSSHCFAGRASDTIEYSVCLGHYEWVFVALVQRGVFCVSQVLFYWAETCPSAFQHGFTLPQVQNFALFWMLIVIAQMLLNNTDLCINHWQTFLTFDCQPLSNWCPAEFLSPAVQPIFSLRRSLFFQPILVQLPKT